MGCGSSTAKQVDEPLEAVLPGGNGATNGGIASVKGSPAPPVVQSPPPKAKKPPAVVYDPFTAAFPPSAASLQRKFPSRPSVLVLNFQPEWKRAGEILTIMRRTAEAKNGSAPSTTTEAKEDGSSETPVPETPATPAATDIAPCVFSDSTHEDNVIAGSFADPHIITALTSLAAHPNRLIRIFPVLDEPQDNIGMDEKKNTHIKGLTVGSKMKSNSLAKISLTESGPKFASSIASGKFQVRLFYGGLWQTFLVDDLVPCTRANDPITGPQHPLFTTSRDLNEFWMMLLEKALAKVKGSYEDIFFSNPIELFRLLTGGSGEILTIPAEPTKEQAEELWTQLAICWKRADLLSCSTRVLNEKQHQALLQSKRVRKKSQDMPMSSMEAYLQDHSELGTDANYSVLDIQQLPPEVGGHRLVLLRNPQGSQKWEGNWSEGSAEWAELEKMPDGGLYAMKLKLSRKKHHAQTQKTPADGTSPAASSSSAQDGLFWICWADFMKHFQAIFNCQVLADNYDYCQTVTGEWKGRSAAGKPFELAAPGASSKEYGNWLYNPQFRIRNTAAKKSGTVVITLSKGTQMCNQLNAAPADEKSKKPPPIFIGFKIVSNQLNHTINCNPTVSSPLFGQLQVSPLHDDLITSKFSQESSVSVSLPFLEPYKDYYILPYTAESGTEGDFVFNLWTNSPNILFDPCPPLPNNPIEIPFQWSRHEGTAAGNLWTESYLDNPTWLIRNTSDDPTKILVNLMKLNKLFQDLNCNLRCLVNVAPNSLNTTAIGTVSAPAKPLAGGGKRGSVLATPGTTSLVPEEKKDDGTATMRKSGKQLAPVSGCLSPFYEVLDGAMTRWGNDSFYNAQKQYPVVLNNILPNSEYFLIASTFTTGTEGEALLQFFSSNLDSIKIERMTRDYHRILDGRWAGVNAAGPARRKKTYLNNPQFCVRHHAPGPISIVVSLILPPQSSNDLAVNITVATAPANFPDPNPFSEEEKGVEKKKFQEAEKKKANDAEVKKKKEEYEKQKAQAQLLGVAGPSSTTQGSIGVASLRIKAKPGAESGPGSKKKKNSVNMFGDAFTAQGSPTADDSAPSDGDALDSSSPMTRLDDRPRVNALTGDYQLVTQTTFNGDLYKQGARLVHLFVPDVQPNKSYFIIPSTSVPGQECDFKLQVYGASSSVELKFEPCYLNSLGDGVDMSALASRRTSVAMSAGLASHKTKPLHSEKGKDPKHDKKKHR